MAHLARRTEATQLLRRSYEVRNTVDLIVADLSSAESGVRGYLITGDRGMLYPFEAASVRLGAHLDELEHIWSSTRRPHACGCSTTTPSCG